MSKDRLCARFVIGQRKYYVFSEWDKDDRAFSLSLMDARSVYKHDGESGADWAISHVTSTHTADAEAVDSKLRPPGLPLGTFCANLRQALAAQDVVGERYTYRVDKPDAGTLQLVVGFLQDDVVVSTTIELRLDAKSQMVGDTLDYLIDRNSALDEQCRKLLHESRRNEAQRDDALRQFDTVRHDKERLEQELYSKFVVVLNMKKHKANEFKRQIELLHERVEQLTAALAARDGTAATNDAPPTAEASAPPDQQPPPEPVKRKPSLEKPPPLKRARASIAQTPTLPTQMSQLSIPYSMPVDDDAHQLDRDDEFDDNDSGDERDDAAKMPPPPVPLGKARKNFDELRPSVFGLHSVPTRSAAMNDNDLLGNSGDDSDEVVPLVPGETALARPPPLAAQRDDAVSEATAHRRVRRSSSEKHNEVPPHSAGSQGLRRGGALAKQPQTVPVPAPTVEMSATRSTGAVKRREAPNRERARRSSRGGGGGGDDSMDASELLKAAERE